MNVLTILGAVLVALGIELTVGMGYGAIVLGCVLLFCAMPRYLEGPKRSS